jgi:hypothetical protein
MSKIKILFLSANPTDQNRLSLDEEYRAITEKIRASEYRDSVELISAWAVRAADLLQSLNQYKPQIVHFCGHGSRSGQLILVDSDGTSNPVSAVAIKELFRIFKDNIHVVLLNACYSRFQAEAIKEVIDCVIGMNAKIDDRKAITFAASFYGAIGFGHSVKGSFEQGKAALLLDGISEADTPELLVKPNVDPAQVFLLNPEEEELSAFEKELLIAASEDGEFIIIPVDEIPGGWIRAGRSNFVDTNDLACAVRYREALERLIIRCYVVKTNSRSYMLTSSGFELARKLAKKN